MREDLKHLVEIPKKLDESLIEAWNEPEKLPEMREWLKVERNEEVCSQYASIVLKKYFERENLPCEHINKAPELWSIFSWQIYLSINNFLMEETHAEMLKELFAELVEFCEAAFPNYFAYHLKIMLEKLFDISEDNAKTKLLLPQKAITQFGEIKQMIIDEYEMDLERQNQMGY